MKKYSIFMSAIAVLFLISACQFGPSSQEQFVTVYSERHYDTDQALYDQFEAITGIEVRVVRDGADQLITRIKNEGVDSPADVLIVSDAGRLHRAKEALLLQPIESNYIIETLDTHLIDVDRQWFALTKRARVIVYHPDRVNMDELSTYEQLTDSKWKNRIVSRSSSNIYNQSLMSSMIEILGEEEALLWAKEFVSNFARDPYGNDRDQAKDIVQGIGDVGIMNTYYIGKMLESSDPNEVVVAETIRIFFPNQETTGTHINISGAGVAKHAKNKEHAIKLIEFLLSEEAQELYAHANFEYPVHPNVLPHALLASWGTFIEQDIPLVVLGTHSYKAATLMNQAGWK